MLLTAISRLNVGRRLCLIGRRNFSRTSCYSQLQSTKKNNEKLLEGFEVEGFQVKQVVNVKDYDCKLIRLEHLGTGAQYTHIDRQDNNNVFGIAFRTTPFDSTGVPHILEHLTLMGSKKYPCRDPFFKMLNRSLATYLNACTYPDFTIYPLATQNDVDYYNLMSVYLDAVFNPKLSREYFQMEGWRLEHENVADKKSPIIFKGVVYNEMKGVYSENQNIFMEKLINSTLPSHTYGVNSGGDPLEIPNLTYEKLVEFRDLHYHPSNSRIYSYGNLELINTLKFVNDHYLSKYNRHDQYALSTAVPLELRWSKPRHQHIYGKNDPMAVDSEKQSMLATSYALGDLCNVRETFEHKILSELLIDGPNTPFYKKLVESNLGSGYVPTVGFGSHTRDTTFNVGLQALSVKDFGPVEEIIEETFAQCVETGFTDESVENVLHKVELSMKHQDSNFGINTMFNLAPLWNHDGDLGEALHVSSLINGLRKSLHDDKYYLQKMVDKYFQKNNHRLVLTMSPDEKYDEQIQNKEEKLLKDKLSQFDEKQKEEIYNTGLELRRIQESKDDVSCLPTLYKKDISLEITNPAKLAFSNKNGVSLQLCSVPTNNVTYFRALLDISDFHEEQRSLLPLFSQIFTEMGTNKYNYREWNELINSKTVGLNVNPHFRDDINDNSNIEQTLSLGSLCLDHNFEGMLNLWNQQINDVNLNDMDRFSTLVNNIASDLTNGVADSGHLYALMNASSRVNNADYMREQSDGLTFINKMKQIASAPLEPVLQELKEISKRLLTKRLIRCALNISPTRNLDELNNQMFKFTSLMPATENGEWIRPFNAIENLPPQCVHYILPFAVNYCAKAIQCTAFMNEDFTKLRVLSKLLSSKYLLPLVRERYGAYGAGAKLSLGGVFQFYSYRDPNTIGTMTIFDDSLTWLRKNEFTDEDIDEAVIAVFREIDVPISPNEQGMRLFMIGINNDQFSEHRRNILNVTRQDLITVAEKYLTLSSAKVILGPENTELKDWQKIYQ